LAKHPGAVESHWLPVDPELWEPTRYPEFLERRRAMLAQATNDFLDGLYAGSAPVTPEQDIAPAPLLPAAAELPADPEDQILTTARGWMEAQGLDVGELDHELVRPDGGVEAVLDLAWPRGLQIELTEPVALLLDEPPEVLEAASRHGYRSFTRAEDLRTYPNDLMVLGSVVG
jgi:hypothetical protein